MRVEMLLPALPRAGMESVAALLADGLRARGHSVSFTCLSGPGELGEDLRARGYRVSVVPAPGLRPNLLPRELAAWFRDVRPDVVHIHNGVWLKAAHAARRAGVPRVVYTCHGFDAIETWPVRMLYRLAARNTDQVVVVSESLRTHLATVLGLSPASLRVVLNGVGPIMFEPGTQNPSLRHEIGIPAGAPVVVNVARLEPVKDHRTLLKAFALLRQTVPDAHLLLVGDGPCRMEIEAHAGALGISTAVRMTGSRSDVVALLKAADVFALSSRFEGTSMSLLEAMAAGVPAVATAVGGTPALLCGGEAGLLVPAGDAPALAASMARVLAERTLRETLVRRARERVESFYSPERMVGEYERIYCAPPSSQD